MENFLKSLFRKGQAGAEAIGGGIKDFFRQEEDELDRPATRAERVGQTVGDYFKPQPIDQGIRVRDVVRESPDAIAQTVGRPILRSLAALGQKIGSGDIRSEYVPETPFEKSIFGTDQPVSFTTIGKETRLANPEDKTIPLLDPLLGGIIAAADAPTGGRAGQTARGTIKAGKEAYEGALTYTTKILEALKGKTTVSRTFIEDLLKQPSIKQSERDLVTKVLRETPDGRVDVKSFAEAVEDEVLPLNYMESGSPSDVLLSNEAEEAIKRGDEVWGMAENPMSGTFDYSPSPISLDEITDYEGFTLRRDNSFVPRYAGVNLPDDVRGDVSVYHERIYESPIQNDAGYKHFSNETDEYFGHTRIEDMADGETRRVIEVQSDLFQKGNLESKMDQLLVDKWNPDIVKTSDGYMVKRDPDQFRRFDTEAEATKAARTTIFEEPIKDLERLTAYRNTWWERMVREEVKDAAQAGKTRLLFPTGETAMKVEGLQNNDSYRQWVDASTGEDILQNRDGSWGLKPGQLLGNQSTGQEWVIREVMADGKFTAIPKEKLKLETPARLRGMEGLQSEYPVEHPSVQGFTETFDLGGKNNDNPIYKFYDKQITKYLENKYGATRFTDENGVTWVQVDVKPQMAKAPVEAFGVAAGIQTDEEGNVEFDPLSALLGVGAVGAVRAVKGNGKPGKMTPKIMKAIQDFFKTSEVKNGSPVKAITESKDSFRVTFENGKNPVLLNKAWAAQNLGITSADQLEEIYKTTKSFKTVGDILKKGDVPPGTTKTMETMLNPKKGERRFITRTRAMEPGLDSKLDGELKTRSTDELAAKADAIIASDMDKAIEQAKTGTDDTAVAVASRLIDRFVTEAKAAKTEEAKDALWERVADIANDAAKNLTENGRAIQAATLLGKTTPEGMVRFAAKTIQNHNTAVRKSQNPLERTLGGMVGTRAGKALKQVPELTPAQAADIVKKMEDIEATTDPIEKAKKMQKLTDEIQAYLPSSLYQKIATVWKAGLLTGLKTTGLNIASNTSHYLSEIVKDVPASMVDRLASLITGKRTLALTGKGTGRGLAEGAKKGWTYWKSGFDERDIGSKLDYKKVNFGKGKVARAIQAYEELVFRTIGSQDQPFYYATKMRSLSSQAIAQAKNAKLRGKEAKAFVENLMQNPTDDMIKYAVLDAETAVFQNKTTLGKAAKAIQDLPGGQFVLPFAKTPSAVATQIINYSPAGIAKTIIENVGKGKFDQRLFSQGMGRGITGTGAVAIGMALYKNGLLTLGYPSSEKEREQWELEGKLPNSIYINGQWRNVGVLGPGGLLTIIGGHFQDGLEETGSLMGGLVRSAAGFGNTLTEQSFLKGVNGAIEAIQDPARSFQGFASSLAGSIIPTIIGDIARATDDFERQAATPGTRIQSRIPGLRDNLEPKVDTLGNKIDTQGFWTVMMDPTRPGNASALPEDKPVVEELRRLSDAGFPTTPTQLGPNAGYESLTPEENTYLWRIAGLAAKDAIQSSMEGRTYSRLDDEEKSKMITDRIDEVKVEARARVVLKATANMEGAQLTQKLAKMKEDGLLTKQVFEKYQSLKRREN